MAKAIYNRRLRNVEQALKVAEQNNISRNETEVPPDELPDSELFMLGRPMLKARLENLQAVGPQFDLDYDQNRAMLNTLNVGPTLDPRFQTYRYLRTPEEPVKRDSPRRAFMMIMWGNCWSVNRSRGCINATPFGLNAVCDEGALRLHHLPRRESL